MNNLDKNYKQLLQDIIDYGVEKKDRTRTGTKSIFGYTIRHNMAEGFPLLTTKKMAFKQIVTELLWFLRGDTNIKYLVDNDCHIWDGDAYKNFTTKCKSLNLNLEINKDITIIEGPTYNATPRLLNQEEFINKIKTDDEFAKQWGELGSIYGKQWRNWNHPTNEFEGYDGIDQIKNLINEIKTNPDSRRLMVNAWNVGELDQMVLPPCHYGFQVYTREMSVQERQKYSNYYDSLIGEYPEHHITLDERGVPRRAISLMWNQRSVDTFLGLPFNIASYGLLLEILAKEVNMVPDQLIGNLGDVHLYSNHIEQAKEQIGRPYTPEERETMLKEAMGSENYNKAVEELMPFGGGMSEYYDLYKIPKHTREPFDLPSVKIKNEVKWKEGDCLPYYSFNDFTLENYQSHSTIKAPLSN